jgi:hypothetical protein
MLVLTAIAFTNTVSSTSIIVGAPSRPDRLIVSELSDLDDLGAGGTILDTGKSTSMVF